MKNSLVGQDVLIHCYKHDGKPHRTWSRCKILEETDRHFIGINNNTLVTESDGRSLKNQLSVIFLRIDGIM